jgi:hypothetical protein
MLDPLMFDLGLPRADSFSVSCLRCGYVRTMRRSQAGQLEPAECSSCSYVGWRESRAAVSPSRRTPWADWTTAGTSNLVSIRSGKRKLRSSPG